MSGSLARTLWNIPYQRNPFFTGREDVLTRLDRALHTEQRVALSQPQGITGLGGIGKTQTVVEYAYRHREEYDVVLWARADSVAALISSMIELAQILELPERKGQDQEIIVQAVLRWLRLHSGWLLIYDNIDDLSLAEPFLPKAGAGHLLFTTRAHALSGLAQHLDIQQMDQEIGALLLLRRASLLALQATLNMAKPDDQNIARAISQELDGLPLALDQAGAYIKEAACPLPDYLARYQTRHNDILQKRGSFNQDYPASVATTWSLSFEKVGQALSAAAELLKFCAFLAPDAIPEEIITEGAPYLGDILSPVVANPVQFDQICREVLRFSLFQRGVDSHIITIHRLVQVVLRDYLSVETQQQWMLRAVRSVDAVFPLVEFANWSTCERLLPQALICATWITQTSLVDTKAARLLSQTGYYLQDRAEYGEAESALKQALLLNEQIFGLEHPDVAQSLNDVAQLYHAQGHYEQAESFQERALSMRQRLLKWDHSDIAESRFNLALIYKAQGKYPQAQSLYEQVLAIDEEQAGSEHPRTAHTLNNLAQLYRAWGKDEQAEPLFVRAISIRERTLDPRDPDLAYTYNNLGALYLAQSNFGKAEPLLLRTLSILSQILKPQHPDLALIYNNLGALYYAQGKYEQAEPFYLEAQTIKEQIYEPDHPLVAASLNNLANLYRAQGKYEQAELLYQRALAIFEQVLGPNHPNVAKVLENYADLLEKMRQSEEAIKITVRAQGIRSLLSSQEQ
jgi:tetratricopeptide (TPR) repeat protein